MESGQIEDSINDYKRNKVTDINFAPVSCRHLVEKVETLIKHPQEGLHKLRDIQPYNFWLSNDREFYNTNCKQFFKLVNESNMTSNMKIKLDKNVDGNFGNTNVVTCNFSDSGIFVYTFGCI